MSLRNEHKIGITTVLLALVAMTSPAWALSAEQEARLAPSDGQLEDDFGGAIALDGNSALIGAPGLNLSFTSPGKAYVFTRTGSVWTEQARLLAPDGAIKDHFGDSVDLNGDTAIIGAWGDDDNGSVSGSVYVFTYTAGEWTQQAKLVPADGVTGDVFGRSVAIDGDTAVIGATGSDDNGPVSGTVYVFTRTDGVWTEQAKLYPSDATDHHRFGHSVTIDGNTALIGATWDSDIAYIAGAAYVFTRTAGVWTQQAKLLPAELDDGSYFGHSVALDGDTAIIGAYGDETDGVQTGSAHVFTRTGGVWTEQAKLVPPCIAGYDGFGRSVALDGNTAVISATGSGSRTVYVFTRVGGVWTGQVDLMIEDGPEGDSFAPTVAIDGDTTVAGASTPGGADADDGYSPPGPGAAYVFRLIDDGDDGGVDCTDVPAVGGLGVTLILLALAGTGAYFVRRGA